MIWKSQQYTLTKTRERACHLSTFYGTLPSMKTMKKLIWLMPQLIILGAMLVAVEIKGSSPSHEVTINYNYGNLIDTSGRYHSVQLVLHPDGSVTWRDLTHHIR
jgi:hypothetical protein